MTSKDGKDVNEGHENQCAAVTSKGTRCRNKALSGLPYCRTHMPGSLGDTQSADLAEIRLLLEQILVELVSMKQASASGADPRRVLMEEWGPKVLSFLNEGMELLKRRVDGDYEVDEWGMDEELLNLCQPFFQFMYKSYFRVETTGLENVPAEGRALLVANHSGVLPWDAVMVMTAIREEHKAPRHVRGMHLSWIVNLPVLGLAAARMGQVQALPQNSERLLKQDHLVLVFPEGTKGIGKPFRQRYQLARFGRGGFVRSAIAAQAPIIPVSIVGAEEIHPMISDLGPMASALRVPYIPVTPTFPWLGPLGLIPLPTKWYIHFGEPILVHKMEHRPSEAPMLVTKVTNEVRDIIQQNIYKRLRKRRAVFW